jgi:hypothetical protein
MTHVSHLSFLLLLDLFFVALFFILVPRVYLDFGMLSCDDGTRLAIALEAYE